jgi:hypothetical protein
MLYEDNPLLNVSLAGSEEGGPYNSRGYCASFCTNAHWCGGNLDIAAGEVHAGCEQDGGTDAEVTVRACVVERRRLLVLFSLGR